MNTETRPRKDRATAASRGLVVADGDGGRPIDPLRKPVNTLAIVPQSKRITPLARKAYNVMLHMAQAQGIERPTYRSLVSEVIAGLDFDSNDTQLIKKHLRSMAATTVEWQSPTTGEGSSWTVSGLLAHAKISKEKGQNWIEWSYSIELKQELLEPSVFAKLSIEIISQLRTHAGIALYEICTRYKDIGRTSRQPWPWWRPVLSGQPETPRTQKLEYRFFKRDTLKPAIAEVNAITDLEVELVEHKEGRFISELQFLVKRKAQTPLPLRNPPEPVDMSLIALAQRLGVTDDHAEELLDAYGSEALRAGLAALEKRIATAFPAPLRDPYRYLKSLMPGEAEKQARQLAVQAATPVEKPLEGPPPDVRRKAQWEEEWRRQRRERVIADLEALSDAEQARIVASLIDDMAARDVHPSIRRRLEQSGWRHPLVINEMIKFYAQATIGEHWDRPSAEELLGIAAHMAR